jgi:centromeric protein E
MVKLTRIEDFKKLLTLGEKARKYRATDLNEHSSRSHSIFRIMIENRLSETRRIVAEKQADKAHTEDEEHEEATGTKHLSFATKYSYLNLIDLAGSEKLSEDGVISETSNINKSLLVLSNVINKLSDIKKGS